MFEWLLTIRRITFNYNKLLEDDEINFSDNYAKIKKLDTKSWIAKYSNMLGHLASFNSLPSIVSCLIWQLKTLK